MLSHFAEATCNKESFFAFPTWYKYLPTSTDARSNCVPVIKGITDIWLIVAAIVDILLRVAALVAVFFIVYAGVQFIMAQGEPDKTAKARSTILDAVVGLVIAVMAAALVSFVAGRFVAVP